MTLHRLWLCSPLIVCFLVEHQTCGGYMFHFPGCLVSVHKGKPQMNHKLQIKVMCMKCSPVIGQTVGEVERYIPHKSSIAYIMEHRLILIWEAHQLTLADSAALHGKTTCVNCPLIPRLSAVRRRYYRRWLALMRLETERHLCPSELYVCPLTHISAVTTD